MIATAGCAEGLDGAEAEGGRNQNPGTLGTRRPLASPAFVLPTSAHGSPSALSVLGPFSFALLLCTATTANADPAPDTLPEKPPPTVTLTLADPSPVIGVTGETELRIQVADGPTDPMPMPRVRCSLGQVEDLGREGPASFSARYILPAGRFPQSAIIVAEFANPSRPLRGMTTVRLRAATTKTLFTDRGARVTLRVGDRDFGPQRALADGAVHFPIVVPPGVEFATARAVNQYGKATEQTLSLNVPYSQRVLFAAPDVLVAGSVAEVAVYAVDPSGSPADGANLVLRAGKAKVYPLGGRIPGEACFLVRAPAILREKSLRMEAQLKGQSTTRVATRIALVPAPATGLTLEPEAPHLGRAPGSAVRVFLGAEDVFGNPVDASRAEVTIDGDPAQVKADGDEEPMVVVKTPATSDGRQDVVVEGVLDMGYAMRRIPIGIKQRPARPQPREANPSPHYTLTPRLGLLWNLGAAAGATFFIDALAFRSARHPSFGVGLSLGIAQSWFSAENAGGITRTSLATVPILFCLQYRASTGRTFLGLGAGAGFAMSWARASTYGVTIAGTSYGAAGEASVETGIRLRDGHFVASLRYLAVYLDRFSSGDRINGNAAGAMIDVGYRLGF
jgi:hypothetical protein